MRVSELRFSIAAHAAWAPGLTTPQAWLDWAQAPFRIHAGADPQVAAMPAMLRRRAGALGKMALEAAYAASAGRRDIPVVFCSRHGDVGRALDLLGELARGEGLSPTSFGLAVHNASAGLFSIARGDKANHMALAAGTATVEHGVVEACGLLADGAAEVLLVVYDCPLPGMLASFEDCDEQPHAWAWVMTAPKEDVIGLQCGSGYGSGHVSPGTGSQSCAQRQADGTALPGSLEVLRFQLGGDERLERVSARQHWTWTRHA